MTIVLREYIAKSRSKLRDALFELLPNQGSYPTRIPGLSLHRFDREERPKPMIYAPILVVVVQGRKWVKVGTDETIYGERSCFVAGIDMPVFCCVKEASPEKPYLALTLELEYGLIARLAALEPLRPDRGRHFLPGAGVQNISYELLDACLRLLRLQARPEQIRFLAPLFREEIHYRLLQSPFGGRLRELYATGSPGNQLLETIDWLGRNYKRPLHVEILADMARMPLSTFHRSFKSVTTLSPLQYRKRLQLNEAQRLLLAEKAKAAETALNDTTKYAHD